MRRGFTLIELLVSLLIMGLVLLFLYGAIDNLMKANRFYEEKERLLEKNEAVTRLITTDILQARSINFADNDPKNYSILSLQTTNSLYGIPKPYVLWLVAKADDTLIRLESPYPMPLPLSEEYLPFVRIEPFGTQTHIFKIYRAGSQMTLILHQGSDKPQIIHLLKEVP
ncbi:MAG: prepilin-type N-terminal cleavage/methylation domain-containing protein [Campylobacterales bacterium]